MSKPEILFAAFEAVPFIKTGGLGDVAGSLPAALNQAGGDVRLIMPKFGSIPQQFKEKMEHLADFYMDLSWRHQYCGVDTLVYNGVTIYFIDNEYYFKRDNAYGYYDDGERISFFSKAVLETLRYLPDFRPAIIHCNDWHTALIPVYLRTLYAGEPFFSKIKTVFTIHNLRFQGVFSDAMVGDVLGLSNAQAGKMNMLYDGAVNFMRGAVYACDRITTVSPSYAEEICTEYFGEHMQELFQNRKNVLSGILNGIDTADFDPQTDKALSAHFSVKTIWRKRLCKEKLQQELGLDVRADVPLIVLISRLTDQKGLDLLLAILEELMAEDCQFAVLGVGDSKYEDAFRSFAARMPGKFAACLKFDGPLSHRFYAGADISLVPSLFEPCGLTQMISMRYGTLPLVRETGGLKDSVAAYNKFTGEGNGFSFANYNAHELLFTAKNAMALYRNQKEAWTGLMKNAMASDFSWHASAQKYIELYQDMMESPCQHDSFSQEYRRPFGAVPVGTPILLAAKCSSEIIGCALVIHADGQNFRRMPMVKGSDGKWYCEIYAPKDPGLLWYHFEYSTPFETVSCGVAEKGMGGKSICYNENDYQITVYHQDSVPQWFTNGIAYQIFPDRFFRGRDFMKRGGKLPTAKCRHYLQENWEELPYYDKEEDGSVNTWPFWGGTLQGICEKLPYLKSLGISILYLNPIFAANSNHRYDTADYMSIDPLLGKEEDFRILATEAKNQGIHIILDGVFNHTGAKSLYFDSEQQFGGACTGEASPYYDWFSFDQFPEKYDCWWGVKDLPAVNENVPSFRRYICGKDGVLAHWLRLGADGWRLDVADELPDDFIQEIRRTCLTEKPDSLLMGEVWEDASNKISYGQRRQYFYGHELQSAMNYPFRENVLGYLLGELSGEEYCLRSKTLQEHYPHENYLAAFNLLGSHDRVRALTLLSGKKPPKKECEKRLFRLSAKERELAIKRLKLAALLQFVSPGVPCIYYGDEAGTEGLEDPYNRGSFPWGHEDRELLDYYRSLSAIRRTLPQIQTASYSPYVWHESVLVIQRKGDKGILLAIMNRNDKKAVSLPVNAAISSFKALHGNIDIRNQCLFLHPLAGILIFSQENIDFSDILC